MSWEQGRNLASVSHSETGNEEKTVTTLGNSYDSDGIRTQKTVTVKEYTLSSGSGGEIPIPDPITPLVVEMSLGEGETAAPDVSTTDPLYVLASTTVQTHSYVTQSGKIIRETVTSADTATQLLDFLYDENGRPFALKYTNGTANPATYYYVLNLQGDVLGLINASGTIVARYTYNAWGEILTATGTMAEINPLRYRGYYYDTETGFYYLQSRYFDPVTHRFINADSLTSTGQGFVGTNMFAYCNNSPVILSDTTGFFPELHFQLGPEMMTEGGHGLYTYVFIPSPPFWPSPETEEAARAVNHMRKDATSVVKGVRDIIAPVPTAAEDVIGVGRIAYGIIRFCYGLAKFVAVLAE